MTASTYLNLDDYPDSAYAAELRRGLNKLRFEPVLEFEFTTLQLRRERFRIRIWWYTAIILVPILAVVRIYELQLWSAELWLRIALVIASIYAVSVTYSTRYEQRYRRQRVVLIPLCSCAAVMLSTATVMHGDDARLVAVAATIMCVFLISGALFRTAVVSCAMMMLVYGVMIISADVSVHFKATSIAWLAIVAIIGTVFGLEKEKLQRRHFLESGLINELVERDSLTKIRNRRAYDRHLERIWQQAVRDLRTVAVMLIDIDHFKQYNDSYGHQAGDDALRRVARVIEGFARRPLDLAARYGGEEFSIILYDITPEAALKLAEQVRQAVASENIAHRASPTGSTLTISIGLALASPVPGGSPREALVKMADEALYAAKQAGRNRVQFNDHHFETTETGPFRTPLRS